jgi:hypothetical protein
MIHTMLQGFLAGATALFASFTGAAGPQVTLDFGAVEGIADKATFGSRIRSRRSNG